MLLYYEVVVIHFVQIKIVYYCITIDVKLIKNVKMTYFGVHFIITLYYITNGLKS